MTDYIVARPKRDGFGHALFHSDEKYLGFALTLAQAQRLVVASGAALIIER